MVKCTFGVYIYLIRNQTLDKTKGMGEHCSFQLVRNDLNFFEKGGRQSGKSIFKTKEKTFYPNDQEVLVCGTEISQLPFFQMQKTHVLRYVSEDFMHNYTQVFFLWAESLPHLESFLKMELSHSLFVLRYLSTLESKCLICKFSAAAPTWTTSASLCMLDCWDRRYTENVTPHSFSWYSPLPRKSTQGICQNSRFT